jgi:replicative DNA helicase
VSLERKLLSRLTDPTEIARVWDLGLRSEVFEEPFNQYVYNFIIDYWQQSKMKTAPTALVIATERPGFKFEENVEEEAWWIAGELQSRWARNNLHETLIQGADVAQADPVKAWKWLQARAYEANEVITPRHTRSDMSDYESRRERYRYREEQKVAGMTLGLPELDEYTGGILPGELCTLGAYSGVGKTLFLLHAAAVARKAGYQPIIFTLEMPIDEIEDRLDALLSGVSYSRLSRQKLDSQEMKSYEVMQEAVADMGHLRIEAPGEGERTVSHLVSRARYTNSDFLLIDQLSFMEASEARSGSEKYRQASIMKQLKNEISNATLGKLPCLLAAQFKRESLDRTDGPLIQDFADAAEVERTSDLCLGLSRTQQQKANRTMRLDILKGRRSDTAKYLLKWDLIDATTIEIIERIQRTS